MENISEEKSKENPTIGETASLVIFCKQLFDWAKLFGTALLLALFVKTFIFQFAYVPTGSMEPIIMTSSRLVISKIPYYFNEPQRGDVISFLYPDDESQNYLKRIIGLPGETVEGKDGKIYINGEDLGFDYTTRVFVKDFGPYEVPEDQYFMMGDNRNSSLDSRYWKNPFVHKNKIVGKVIFQYWPNFSINFIEKFDTTCTSLN